MPVSACAVKSLRSCLTLGDPMDCSVPGSSVHGVSQAKILEWVAIPFSKGSSAPRDQTRVSCLSRWQVGSLPLVPPGKRIDWHFTEEILPHMPQCRCPCCPPVTADICQTVKYPNTFWNTVIPTQTNLLPKYPSCISISGKKRKEILCWNVQGKHIHRSPANELWAILPDTIKYESPGLYRLQHNLWIIWSLATHRNSFIPISILSYSLLHIAGQFSYTFDSTFLKIILAFRICFEHTFAVLLSLLQQRQKKVSWVLKGPNKANNRELIKPPTHPSNYLSTEKYFWIWILLPLINKIINFLAILCDMQNLSSRAEIGSASPAVFVFAQSLNHVWLFVTLWTAGCQASLTFILTLSLLKFMSI